MLFEDSDHPAYQTYYKASDNVPSFYFFIYVFSLGCNLNPSPAEPGYTQAAFANSVDPDQLASEEAN